MRVVLDTNVVVSMLLDTPALRPLYEAFRSGLIEPVVTDETLDELHEVLSRPELKIDAEAREEFLAVLQLRALRIANPVLVTERSDPGDNAVLGAALSAHAVLVTGDLALRRLHPFRQMIPILSPRHFLAWLSTTR